MERRPVFSLGDKSGLQQVFIQPDHNAANSHRGKFCYYQCGGDRSEVRVSISDHGLGISPEAQQHLFVAILSGQECTIAEIPAVV